LPKGRKNSRNSRKPEHEHELRKLITFLWIGSISLIILSLLVIIGFLVRKIRKKQKQTRRKLLEMEKNQLNSLYVSFSATIDPDDLWEVPSSKVLVNYDQKLGSGAFGQVYQGSNSSTLCFN